MMGEIVNLRSVRKLRRKEADAQAASENRVRHGRSGAQKRAEREESRRAEVAIDGHRRDRADGDAEP